MGLQFVYFETGSQRIIKKYIAKMFRNFYSQRLFTNLHYNTNIKHFPKFKSFNIDGEKNNTLLLVVEFPGANNKRQNTQL